MIESACRCPRCVIVVTIYLRQWQRPGVKFAIVDRHAHDFYFLTQAPGIEPGFAIGERQTCPFGQVPA